MANEKDIVSKESKPAPKSWAEQSAKERLKSVGKGVASVLRRPTSKLGNMAARASMYTMKARANVAPPNLFNTDTNNKPISTAQLQRDTFTFTSKSGKTQDIEGFHLQAQPGKPTIVYFGGSDFDRTQPGYQEAIRKMANRAKEEGCGFAVYDYPRDAGEQRIKDWVQQTQDHLETDLGVPKNTQAYSGYSLGSFSAAHAANINQDAVGLQITSGFSSGRMAQKEGMKDMLGKAGSDILMDKSQLTDVLDTALETRQIQQRLNGQGPQKMPVALVYSDTEEFGRTGNRHMSAVEKELGVTNPGVSTPGVKVSIANNAGHLQMMGTDAHLDSFKQFVKDSSHYTNAQQQAVAVTPVVVTPPLSVTPPSSLAPTSDVTTRPRSQSVRDSLKEQSGDRKVEMAERSVGKKLSESDGGEVVKKPAPQRGRSMTH